MGWRNCQNCLTFSGPCYLIKIPTTYQRCWVEWAWEWIGERVEGLAPSWPCVSMTACVPGSTPQSGAGPPRGEPCAWYSARKQRVEPTQCHRWECTRHCRLLLEWLFYICGQVWHPHWLCLDPSSKSLFSTSWQRENTFRFLNVSCLSTAWSKWGTVLPSM